MNETMYRLLDTIPEPLRGIIFDHRHLLAVQGVIQKHRQSYRLRFREMDGPKRSHRSIDLGKDPEVVVAIETLIAHWRAELEEQWQVERESADQALAERQEHRQQRLMAVAAVGGSRRLRREVGHDFDRALSSSSPFDAVKFAMTLPHAYSGPGKAGRPKKNTLW